MPDLSADTLSGRINGMKSCGKLELTLPCFSLTYRQEMIPVLRSLGITDAFDLDAADFSRMADFNKLDGKPFISEVIHQTALEVDESGTRAAAVTIFHTNKSSAAMVNYTTMVVNHPFICAIVDKPTGAVLFVGVVNNPQKINN